MDQIIFVIAGTVITVAYYILSPVKLSDRVTGLMEKLGKMNNTGIAVKEQKVSSYYVRKF
jgi:hypothetical protein